MRPTNLPVGYSALYLAYGNTLVLTTNAVVFKQCFAIDSRRLSGVPLASFVCNETDKYNSHNFNCIFPPNIF